MPVISFPDRSIVAFPDWLSADQLKQAASHAWSQLQAGVDTASQTLNHLATDPNNVPLDSYTHATERGLANIGQGVAQAVQGAGHMIAHPVDTLANIGDVATLGTTHLLPGSDKASGGEWVSAAAALPSQTKAVIANRPTLADIGDVAGVTAGNLIGNELISAGTQAVLPKAKVPSSTETAEATPKSVAEPEAAEPSTTPDNTSPRPLAPGLTAESYPWFGKTEYLVHDATGKILTHSHVTEDAAVQAANEQVGYSPTSEVQTDAPTAAATPETATASSAANPWANLKFDQAAVAQAKAEMQAGKLPEGMSYVQRAQQLKEQLIQDAQSAQKPTEVAAPTAKTDATTSQLPDEASPAQVNGSGESAASVEAINRLASEKAAGTRRVVVDTRSGAERPLIGADAVDYQPRPYESVEFRGGNRDGEVIDQGPQTRPYKRQLVKPNMLPEADVARLTWNVNELNRLLEGDPAIKKVRDLKAQIPSMLSDIRETQQGLRREIRSLREAPNFDENSPQFQLKAQQMQDLQYRRSQLVKLYSTTPDKLGEVQKQYFGNVYPDPRLRTNLTDEGRANVTQKVQARIDAAHANIRKLLQTETDPVKRTRLEHQLNTDTVVKLGKGTRPDVVQHPDGTVEVPTPEISLKVVRQLNRTLGDGRQIRDLASLVPDADRERIQELKQADPVAYRQAVQENARNWVSQLRDNINGQLEAAKMRASRARKQALLVKRKSPVM